MGTRSERTRSVITKRRADADQGRKDSRNLVGIVNVAFEGGQAFLSSQQGQEELGIFSAFWFVILFVVMAVYHQFCKGGWEHT